MDQIYTSPAKIEKYMRIEYKRENKLGESGEEGIIIRIKLVIPGLHNFVQYKICSGITRCILYVTVVQWETSTFWTVRDGSWSRNLSGSNAAEWWWRWRTTPALTVPQIVRHSRTLSSRCSSTFQSETKENYTFQCCWISSASVRRRLPGRDIGSGSWGKATRNNESILAINYSKHWCRQKQTPISLYSVVRVVLLDSICKAVG